MFDIKPPAIKPDPMLTEADPIQKASGKRNPKH